MKWRPGWVVSTALLLATTAANAATLVPTEAGRLSHGGAAIVQVSDFRGPYAALPEDGPMMPRYAGALLPPEEVYAVLRESGFSPLGVPRLRGAIYMIAAVDRSGDDGRLFIDARSGRILSFMPAYQMGENYREELGSAYGAYDPQAAPPMPAARGVPRPPASIPQVASRAAPMPPQPAPPVTIVMPKAFPPAAAARPPEPALPRAAAVEATPLAAPAGPPAAAPATVAQSRPAPQILPTQAMPKAQDLEY